MAHPKLPQPEVPYTSLAAFLSDVIHAGSCNPDPRAFSDYYNAANAENQETFRRQIENGPQERTRKRLLRGSSNLSCDGLVALTREGVVVDSIPPERQSILYMGHVMHGEVYARIQSAIPDFMLASIEVKLSLPEWWPHALDHAADNGTADLIFTVSPLFLNGPEYYKWFAKGVEIPMVFVGDVKSCSTYLYPGYAGKKDMNDPQHDLYGYVSQMALYSDAVGSVANGGVLLFINRDRPGDRVAVQQITGQRLTQELADIKRRVLGEFCPHKAQSFPQKTVERQCGNWRTGKAGYCDVSEACMKRRMSFCDF